MYQQALEKVSKQVLIRDRYDNFIGGKWVAPTEGKYFENPSPITGKRLCDIPPRQRPASRKSLSS